MPDRILEATRRNHLCDLNIAWSLATSDISNLQCGLANLPLPFGHGFGLVCIEAMLRAGIGLTRVPLGDLKHALAALHRGELACPLTIQELTRVGLQHCAQDLLATLRGLDATAARAVLVAVLAERLKPRDEP